MKALKEYKNEIQKFPHPRSIKAIEANAVRWGSLSGFNAAEPLELVNARLTNFSLFD